jgi:hypothetical protein
MPHLRHPDRRRDNHMEVAVTTTLTPPDDDPTYDEPYCTQDDAAYAHTLGEARMEDYWMARRAAWYRQQREKNGEQ